MGSHFSERLVVEATLGSYDVLPEGCEGSNCERFGNYLSGAFAVYLARKNVQLSEYTHEIKRTLTRDCHECRLIRADDTFEAVKQARLQSTANPTITSLPNALPDFYS